MGNCISVLDKKEERLFANVKDLVTYERNHYKSGVLNLRMCKDFETNVKNQNI